MKRKFGLTLNTENVVALVMFPLAFVLPLFMSAYKIGTYSYYYANIILALSITLLWGFTGVFSFGHAAFMGLGAYVYGKLGQAAPSPAYTPLALVAAVVIVSLFGALLAYFMFYGGVNDVFVGLITLCTGITFETFLGQTAGDQWKVLGVPLGGYNGMTKIPMLHIGTHKLDPTEFYLLTLVLVIVVYIAIRKVQYSRYGYSLIAIRENRNRSELFGYNVPKIQVVVFTISVAMAALAGVLYGAWGNYVSPNNMSMTASTIPVVIVASGGRKNATAAVLFAIIYYILSNTLSSNLGGLNLIVLGFILFFVLLFIPRGLFSALFDLSDRFFARFKPAGKKEVAE
jgi:branched-chain amino acid transport system permease protein